MSHYVVGVIVENIGQLDTVMEPYDENLEVEPRIDMTKEELAEEFEDVKKAIREGTNKFLVEENEKNDVLGMTPREFNQWYYGGSMFDDEGNLLTTRNPNGKWDWFVIGGRWEGYLKLKDGSRANYAKIKDIDFSMDKKAYEEAKRYWELVVDGELPEEGEEKPFSFYKKEYYLETYGDKEAYAKRMAQFSVFALLNEGEWFEQGQMGWFGMSDKTKESEDAFLLKMQEIINNANPEHYFIVVDCHI